MCQLRFQGDKGYCYIPYDYMTDALFCSDVWTVRQLQIDELNRDHWKSDDSLELETDDNCQEDEEGETEEDEDWDFEETDDELEEVMIEDFMQETSQEISFTEYQSDADENQ
jgi:hypothetical protein